MGDLSRELQSALSHVQAQWDEAEGAREFGRRRHRRVVRRRMAGASLLLLLVAAGGALWFRPRPPVMVPDGAIHFADGSTATPVGDAIVQKTGDAALALRRGGVQMLVTHLDRRFRIDAELVVIESVGARFAAERMDAAVRVTVSEGEVLVAGRRLAAGASELFPPPPIVEEEKSLEAPPPLKHAVPRADWRHLAEDGDYDRAYAALKKSAPVRDEPAELLLAADVARLSHHAAEAVTPLHQIVRDHRGDARAPLAAFTLGRVLLEDLGQPAEAAEAFADAEALAPRGALAQDAVAREVEAWSRAGETTRARARAEQYLQRFPDGRRVRSVRRFGGLD